MSIRVSKKHGVNPSVELCFYCGEGKGVALFGKLSNQRAEQMFLDHEVSIADVALGDVEAPRQVILNKEPCDKCKENMSRGVALIKVKTPEDNPQPTGQYVVVTEDWVNRMISPPELRDQILEKRMAYITESDWEQMGFNDIPEETRT